MTDANDDAPRFRGWEDTPGCDVSLVGENILLFQGRYRGSSNHYCVRAEVGISPEQVAVHIFDALAHAGDPGPGGTAGDPPYYVVAAGMTDLRKFHKARSSVSVKWIKKPHQAGTNVWMPGVYLNPMKRERRVGSFIGLGNDYNRGPIPPDDHQRIGREVMELFRIIREDFGG